MRAGVYWATREPQALTRADLSLRFAVANFGAVSFEPLVVQI